MSNKEILIITYYWPPSGGPAVQRWLTFSNLLLKKGFKPVILTVDENTATYPVRDQTLENRVSEEIEVFKTQTFELFHLYGKFIGKGKIPQSGFANESNPNFFQKAGRFVRGNFFHPDGRVGWNKYLIPKAVSLIRERNIEVFITAGPPHSTNLAGVKIKKNTGAKWIADFHDAWTDIWFYDSLYKTPPAKWYDRRLEKKVLSNADGILTVGEVLKDRLAERTRPGSKENIHIVPMGYDEELFKARDKDPSQDFVITYTGTIADNYEPEIFFEVLKEVIIAYPETLIRTIFIGTVSEGIRNHVQLSGLENYVEFKGYVPHSESVNYLFDSSALLLVSPKVKNEKVIIPGKIYEYLAARRPIINISDPESNPSLILKECNAGKSFSREMKKELKAYLTDLIEKHHAGEKGPIVSNECLKKYSRVTGAENIAEIINGLLKSD